MPSRFKVLKNLDENTTSLLKVVRDSHLKSDFIQRRFKTTAPAEIEGLRSLFAQLAVLDSPQLDRIIEASEDEKGFYVLTPAPLEGITLPEMLARGPLSAEEFKTLASKAVKKELGYNGRLEYNILVETIEKLAEAPKKNQKIPQYLYWRNPN